MDRAVFGSAAREKPCSILGSVPSVLDPMRTECTRSGFVYVHATPDLPCYHYTLEHDNAVKTALLAVKVVAEGVEAEAHGYVPP